MAVIDRVDATLWVRELLKRWDWWGDRERLIAMFSKVNRRTEVLADGLKEVYGMPQDKREIMAWLSKEAQEGGLLARYAEFLGGGEPHWAFNNDHVWALPPDEMK